MARETVPGMRMSKQLALLAMEGLEEPETGPDGWLYFFASSLRHMDTFGVGHRQFDDEVRLGAPAESEEMAELIRQMGFDNAGILLPDTLQLYFPGGEDCGKCRLDDCACDCYTCVKSWLDRQTIGHPVTCQRACCITWCP